jgi:hypothetical protein
VPTELSRVKLRIQRTSVQKYILTNYNKGPM